MPIARIEPSGCGEFHGNVVARIAFYLEPDDARYDERHYLVSEIPESGYPGETQWVDREVWDRWQKNGITFEIIRHLDGSFLVPVDMDDYQQWLESLPKKWQLAPFHNHFLYLPPDVTEDIIIAKANLHLPNFYAAWLQELDKVPGGMRKGWDVATRARPIRYDKVDPELYKLRKPQCLEKAQLIKALAVEIRRKEGGQLFSATAIDIGAAAIDRGDYSTAFQTMINKENPANDAGTIDTAEVYANTDVSDMEAANFEEVSANTFTSRDSETIGDVSSGSKQTFSGLDMDVASGDYLGEYRGGGRLELDTSGYAGLWRHGGDNIPCTDLTFDYFDAGDAESLYGTGETVAVGIENKSANMAAKMIAGKLI